MSNQNFESSEFEGDDFESGALSDAGVEVDDLQSENLDSLEIGKTSAELQAANSGDAADDSSSEKKYDFSVFDAMLLISLVCVTLATIFMFFALGEYGNIFSNYPWRTTDF